MTNPGFIKNRRLNCSSQVPGTGPDDTKNIKALVTYPHLEEPQSLQIRQPSW